MAVELSPNAIQARDRVRDSRSGVGMRQADLLSFLGSAQLARWPPWWWHGHGLNCGARHSGHGRVRSTAALAALAGRRIGRPRVRGRRSWRDMRPALRPRARCAVSAARLARGNERLVGRLRWYRSAATIRRRPRRRPATSPSPNLGLGSHGHVALVGGRRGLIGRGRRRLRRRPLASAGSKRLARRLDACATTALGPPAVSLSALGSPARTGRDGARLGASRRGCGARPRLGRSSPARAHPNRARRCSLAWIDRLRRVVEGAKAHHPPLQPLFGGVRARMLALGMRPIACSPVALGFGPRDWLCVLCVRPRHRLRVLSVLCLRLREVERARRGRMPGLRAAGVIQRLVEVVRTALVERGVTA